MGSVGHEKLNKIRILSYVEEERKSVANYIHEIVKVMQPRRKIIPVASVFPTHFKNFFYWTNYTFKLNFKPLCISKLSLCH